MDSKAAYPPMRPAKRQNKKKKERKKQMAADDQTNLFEHE